MAESGGTKIGTMFAEIDLDRSKYDAGLAAALDNAKSVSIDVEKAWRTMGTKSTGHIDNMRANVVNAYELIKNKSTSTTDDILRAEIAAKNKLEKINQKFYGGSVSHIKEVEATAKQATSVFKQMFASFTLANIATDAIYGLGRAIKTVFSDAFNSVEEFKLGSASLAATIATFAKTNGKNMAEVYQQSYKYAEQLNYKMEEWNAKTVATGANLRAMVETMTQAHVTLDIYNKEQEKGVIAIANALALVTQGQEQDKQFRQEIRGLLDGEVRFTNRLSVMIDSMVDGPLTKQVDKWRESGTLIEEIGKLLTGFNEATVDLEKTWLAIGTTLETIYTRILRGMFLPVYVDILRETKKINDALLEQNGIGEQIGGTLSQIIYKGWVDIKNVASMALDTVRAFEVPLTAFGTVLSLIIDGWGQILAVIAPVYSRVTDLVNAMWEIVASAASFGSTLYMIATGQFKAAASAWEASKSSWMMAGNKTGDAFSSGLLDEIEAGLNEYNKKLERFKADPSIKAPDMDDGGLVEKWVAYEKKYETILQKSIEAKQAELEAYKKLEGYKPEVAAAAEAEIQQMLETAVKKKKAIEAKSLRATKTAFKEALKATDEALKQYFADIDSMVKQGFDSTDKALEQYFADIDSLSDEYHDALEKQEKATEEAYADMCDTIQDYTADIIQDWDNAGDMLVDIAKRTAAEMAAAFISQEFITPIVQQLGGSMGMKWNGVPMSDMEGSSDGTDWMSYANGAQSSYGLYSGGMSGTIFSGLTSNVGSSIGTGIFGSSWLGSTTGTGATGALSGSGLGYGGMSTGGMASTISTWLPVIGMAIAGMSWAGSKNAESGRYNVWNGDGYTQIGDAWSGSFFNDPSSEYLSTKMYGAGSQPSAMSMLDVAIKDGSFKDIIKASVAAMTEWTVGGSLINATLGNPISRAFGYDDADPKIKMGTTIKGFDSDWGYNVNPDDMGDQDVIAGYVITYFDTYFSTLDDRMSVSLKNVLSSNSWKTTPHAEDFETYDEMFAAMGDDIFQQLQKPLLESLGLQADAFSETYLTDLAGDGSVAEAFASLAVYADQMEDFGDRVNAQVANGISGETAVNNIVAIIGVLDEFEAATAAARTSTSINAIRSMISAQDGYLDALKEATATQEELAIVQVGIAQQIGASISGLTADSLQSVLISGGDITSVLQATVKGTAAQTIAGLASESIMAEYGNSLNQLIGDAFTNINAEDLNSSDLTAALNNILDVFDWDGMEAQASAAADAIAEFTGSIESIEPVADAIAESIESIESVADAKTKYVSALNAEISALNEIENAYTSATAAYESGLESKIRNLESQQTDLETAATTAKATYIDALGDEIDAQNAVISNLEDMVSEWEGLADSITSSRLDMFTGSDSSLSLGQQTAAAKQRFISTYQAAIGGDADAMADLSRMAEAYLSAAKASTGDMGDYQSIFSSIQAQLASAAEFSAAQESTANDNLTVAEEAAIAAQEQIDTLNATSETLISLSAAADDYHAAQLALDQSSIDKQISFYESQLAEIQPAVMSLEDLSRDYYTAKADFDASDFEAKTAQYQAELDFFDDSVELDSARNDYLQALSENGASDEEISYWATQTSLLTDIKNGIASIGGAGFAGGGISTGSSSGHLELLHGTEAIVPIPNGAIPVQISGGGGGSDTETKELLKALLYEIREDKKLQTKVYRVLDRVSGGKTSFATRAA